MPQDGETHAPGGAQNPSAEEILRLAMEFARDPRGGSIAEGVAGALLAVIGSGPAWTTLQSLLAANSANAAMLHNATHNQQMTNVIGMVATANCVQALLGQEPTVQFPNIPDPGDRYGDV